MTVHTLVFQGILVGFAIEGMAVTNAALYNDKSGLKCKIRYHKNEYVSVCF